MKNQIVFLIALLMGLSAYAGDLCNNSPDLKDWRPWPWGSEIQVPWRNISGVWEPSEGDCEDLFVFKVKTDENGDKMVQITQYNPKTCKVISQGVGYQSNRFIYAQMIRKGKAFNLTIHAFNQADVGGSKWASDSDQHSVAGGLRSAESSGKIVLALSLFPLGEWDKKSAFEITKVESNSKLLCQ